MTISSVVEKVQKLLALSNSSNANEAAAAANKLIDQYRLSQADLEIQGQVEEPLEEDGGYIYESGKITIWKHALMHILVRHYGLSHWLQQVQQSSRLISARQKLGLLCSICILI